MKKELIKSLLNVQAELKPIKKDTKAFNYMYAPLEVIWEQVRKTLTNNGFAVFHAILENGVRTFAIHEHGTLSSFFKFNEFGQEVKNKPQEQGKEITYGKRYNLVAIFNIQLEGEDNDAQPNTNEIRQNQTQKEMDFTKELTGKEEVCKKCGAKLAISKKGRKYCSALCWTKN